MEPLSPADYQIYNRLASQMEHTHNDFRTTWNDLKAACAPSPPPSPSPPPPSTPAENNVEEDDTSDYDLILTGLSFCSGLSNHHAIEERHIFPQLATRMPEFAPGGELTAQHEIIHDGLVRLRSYLRGCERWLEGEGQGYGWGLDRGVLRGFLEGKEGEFERVLWRHLDREVELLRPESLRRCFGVEEVRRFVL
ncbi:hemerythrin domain-containing protein [Aspergillus mulundensis]|uniref:Hemerythrin-like domain-containing protein n=1 Tax=Aspergillus mulundensis TaxID=1810919 RepID=A0A3D8SLC4_9EURO|nr:Uncharacterized protein DSM5745_03752 [Aspergillus mulundensis]RDW87110.1 Uncharacterized protein DSM5745_03752 [Aspergillus mulundensis]